MQCRTETTLEDLLAEPIVLALMERDGVSLDEARRLYDKASSRAKRGKSRSKMAAAGASGFGMRVRPPQAHGLAWM
jgi:hypothetical protein